MQYTLEAVIFLAATEFLWSTMTLAFPGKLLGKVDATLIAGCEGVMLLDSLVCIANGICDWRGAVRIWTTCFTPEFSLGRGVWFDCAHCGTDCLEVVGLCDNDPVESTGALTRIFPGTLGFWSCSPGLVCVIIRPLGPDWLGCRPTTRCCCNRTQLGDMARTFVTGVAAFTTCDFKSIYKWKIWW